MARACRVAILAALAGGLVPGCSGKTSVLVLSVDSIGTLAGVAELDITVANAGQSAIARYLVNPPRTLAPGQGLNLALVFPAGRSGAIELRVDALDLAKALLGQGKATGTIPVGTRGDLSVHIAAGSGGDMGADGGGRDGTTDDSGPSPDAGDDLGSDDGGLDSGADGALIGDDAAPPDLEVPDLQLPDLATPDLSVPASPDLLMPDLLTPDLLTPDLL